MSTTQVESDALDFDSILTLLQVTEKSRDLPKLKAIHDEAMAQLEDMVEDAEYAAEERAEQEAKDQAEADSVAKAEADKVAAAEKAAAGKPVVAKEIKNG